VLLRLRDGHTPWTIGHDIGDVGWNSRWMFINKKSLGGCGDFVAERFVPRGKFSGFLVIFDVFCG